MIYKDFCPYLESGNFVHNIFYRKLSIFNPIHNRSHTPDTGIKIEIQKSIQESLLPLFFHIREEITLEHGRRHLIFRVSDFGGQGDRIDFHKKIVHKAHFIFLQKS